jgi:MvdD pre-ATP grasp domain
MILILSNCEDGHVRPVVEELVRRGEEYRVFDPASYPGFCTVTVENNSRAFISHLRCDGTELDLTTVHSVWLRRPGDFRLSEKLLPGEQKWLRSECSHLFQGLWANLDAFWVSEPHCIRRAGVKLLQLRMAIGLGFRVPTKRLGSTSAAPRCPAG